MDHYIKMNERECDAFSFGSKNDFQCAGLCRRLASAAIDFFVWVVVNNVFGFFYGFWCGLLGWDFAVELYYVVAIFNYIIYAVLLQSSPWQATVGQRCLKIKVTNLNGVRLSLMHALGRTLAQLITIVTCGLGMIPYFFNQRKQALHDIIAGTLVVRK